MKRVTFVLAGIILITAAILVSQKKINEPTVKYVKVDAHKHRLKTIYD